MIYENAPQSRRPDFMRRFDGSQPLVSPEEQQAVGDKFAAFISSVMVQRKDAKETKMWSPVSPVNLVTLYKPARDGLYLWSAAVQHRPEGSGSLLVHPEESITLVFMDMDGREREQFVYHQDDDKVVYREDWPDLEAEERLEDEFGLTQDSESFENSDLEEDMGFNNQPIGMEELDGLITMLTAPDVYVGSLPS